MKLFSAAQIKQCDQQTIKEEGTRSIELMERAAMACLDWIVSRYNNNTPFLIICGMGNNGGDGMALARLLLQNGYFVNTLVLKHTEQFSPDASENFSNLHELAPDSVSILNESDQLTGISGNLVLIDALFGTGINKPITGWIGDFISVINDLPNKKISVDLPSGLPADTLPNADAKVFKADYTLTFQLMKRSLLHREGMELAGRVSILNIGLSRNFIRQTPTTYHITDKENLKNILQSRQPFSHKGDYGIAQLVGGSYGMIGAIGLSTYAALRSGVGLVKVTAPDCGNTTLQTLCPEAIFIKSGENFIEKIEPDEKAFVGIGPGMGQNSLTKIKFAAFLKSAKKPLVLDADALNIIAANSKELMNQIPAQSILTPHPGEFKRLFGEAINSMELLENGRNQAMRLNVVIVLKGHHTVILMPNGTAFYNPTGNAGMAKGGSGDVLTGILTALKARGYSSEHAALLGVWLHGKAGDIAAKKLGMEAMTAKDICDSLSDAFKELFAF